MNEIKSGKVHQDSREEFRRYLIDVMGLTDGSAQSYCSYLPRIENTLSGKTVDEIVSTDDEMQKAIMVLRDYEPKKTAANLKSGLRAYYSFKNGSPYEEVHTERPVGESRSLKSGDMPFEIRQQLNDLEFKMYERQDEFWCRIFQLAVAVLLVVPALMMGDKLTHIVKLFFLMSMVFGSVGLVCMFPLLRRPFRQTKDIYEHGRKILEGEETRLEMNPIQSTGLERSCQRLSVIMFIQALIMFIVTLGVAIF